MNGAFRIAKLDFFTMKSQAVLYVIMVLIVSMFSIMDSSIIVSFITGAWFTALMASNIFVIQEKNNLNRLYGSVSVELKDIVLGRYIFAFSNYAISLVTVIVVSLIVSLFRDMFIDVSNILLGFSLSLLIFSIITGIQMPLFFKLGYTKAKIWAVVPFLVVMLLVIIPSFITVLSTFIQSVMSNRSMIIAVGIVASCVIQLISYKIAVIAYRKRK
jgi:ABC-2 type transport system permease protein